MGAWDKQRGEAKGVGPDQTLAIAEAWRNLVRKIPARTPAAAVTFELVERYAIDRRADGVRGQTIRREIAALRRGLKIAARKGHLSRVPELPLIRDDEPKHVQTGRWHPPDVLRRWFDVLGQGAREEARFALLTGLRKTELKRLRPAWVVDGPNGRPLLRVPPGGGKSKTRERFVGLTDEALEILERCAVENERLGTVFAPTDYRAARNTASKRIGYHQRITLRDLRHCFATNALRASGDAAAVQSALGHTDLRTTQRYQTATLERIAKASTGAAALLDTGGGTEGTPGGHTGPIEPDTSPEKPALKVVKTTSADRENTCLQGTRKGPREFALHLLNCTRCAEVAQVFMMAHHVVQGHTESDGEKKQKVLQ